MSTIPALCEGCGRKGTYTMGNTRRPSWCRCKGTPGILRSPAGVVVCFTFESTDDAVFRERCRLAGNAERQARDNLCHRFVRCGKGWRELPRGNSKRDGLERAYSAALRVLRKCQRECVHPSPSHYNPDCCGVCYVAIETAAA